MPKVSIITINYNGIEDTIECLKSLKKITYPNYDVFVVDNASKNNEGERLKKKFGKYIHLIQSDKNLGFSGGNNLAIREIIKENTSKYVLLLNNDTVVDRSFLEYLVDSAEKNEKIGSIMPQVLQYKNRNVIDSCGIYYYKSGIALILNLNKEKNKIFKENLFSSEGVCSLYRAEALKNISCNNEYFDEDFFMYSEDLDIGFRLIHKGYIPKFEIKSIIYHKRGTTAGEESDFARYYHSRNVLLTIYKNYPTYLLFKYFIPIVIMQFGLSILYTKRWKLGILMKSYIGFFSMIPLIYKKRIFILKNSKVKNKNLLKYFEKSIFPIKWILKK